MTAFGIFVAMLAAHLGIGWAIFGNPLPPNVYNPPADCESYNVGRVECGPRAGGNPRPGIFSRHRKTKEVEGLEQWIRDAEIRAPK